MFRKIPGMEERLAKWERPIGLTATWEVRCEQLCTWVEANDGALPSRSRAFAAGDDEQKILSEFINEAYKKYKDLY